MKSKGHFVYSRTLCWTALDPLGRWTRSWIASMPKNPYKKIALQAKHIPDCLARNGATVVGIDKAKESPHIYEYSFNEKTHKFSLFILGNGAYTIGECTGYCKDTFKHFADKIANECAADDTPFNYSKSNLSDRADEIIGFLENGGAIIEEDVTDATGRRIRLRGPEKDTLTIKIHTNKTVQFQGKRLDLSTKLSDYLSNILALDDVLQSQIEIFSISLTVKQVKDELSEKIPAACSYINEAVRIQMSSSLTLTKVDVEIEDHSYIAFPALRGLEGFIRCVLKEVGYTIKAKDGFGEYFDHAALRKDHASHVGTVKAKILNQCYAYWSHQRHRLFHMDNVDTQTTRRLNAQEARDIVNHVFELIEESSKTLLREKA